MNTLRNSVFICRSKVPARNGGSKLRAGSYQRRMRTRRCYFFLRDWTALHMQKTYSPSFCSTVAVARYLLSATTNQLERAQEHIILKSKTAKCRTATFFTELWVRLGQPKYLDVPMSYQDIADYLGLTIETISRSITDLERSGLISRVSGRKLLLQNRFALGRMMN
jgi:Crp-like helix-turn-helix domain